jgi:3-hydroxybutyryl-CoA dehydrogenase
MTQRASVVAVMGAGTMGPGIALTFAIAGSEVRLGARRQASLDEAAARLERSLAALRGAGLAGDDALTRIALTTSAEEALAGADLVVETITEAVAPKRELLALAERLAAPDAILTTNTSSLTLADLTPALSHPQRFAGLHWLNAPELVEVVEVVAAEQTEPAVLEQLRVWMEAAGKAPVVVRRDVPGFLVNRLQYALLREAWAIVEDGIASPEDVDRVLTHGLGARWSAIGPFQTMDLGGLEVFLAVARNLLPQIAAGTTPPTFLEETVARGAYGAKTGEGLLGTYDGARIAEVSARRERVLLGLRALRDGE